jgi:hypothetical protein
MKNYILKVDEGVRNVGCNTLLEGMRMLCTKKGLSQDYLEKALN